MKSATKPCIPVHDPRFKYVHSSRTDVRITWARFGWTPTQGAANG